MREKIEPGSCELKGSKGTGFNIASCCVWLLGVRMLLVACPDVGTLSPGAALTVAWPALLEMDSEDVNSCPGFRIPKYQQPDGCTQEGSCAAELVVCLLWRRRLFVVVEISVGSGDRKKLCPASATRAKPPAARLKRKARNNVPNPPLAPHALIHTSPHCRSVLLCSSFDSCTKSAWNPYSI